MALKKSITRDENRNRADYPNGYFRIVELTQNQDRKKIIVKVRGYADEEARRYPDTLMPGQHHPHPGGEKHVAEFTAEFDMPEILPVDLVSYAYLMLKKDSRFDGAEDC